MSKREYRIFGFKQIEFIVIMICIVLLSLGLMHLFDGEEDPIFYGNEIGYGHAIPYDKMDEAAEYYVKAITAFIPDYAEANNIRNAIEESNGTLSDKVLNTVSKFSEDDIDLYSQTELAELKKIFRDIRDTMLKIYGTSSIGIVSTQKEGRSTKIYFIPYDRCPEWQQKMILKHEGVN